MDSNVSVATADSAPDVEGTDLRSQLEEPSPFQDDTDEVQSLADQKADSSKSSDSGAETVAQETKSESGTDQDATEQLSNAESSADAEEPKNSYQRRLKDIDRIIKNWNDWNKEKDSFRHEFGTISQQLKALATQQQQGPPRQGYSPKEYLDAAKGLERKAKEAAAVGNVEEADKFLNLASQARDNAQVSYQQQVQTQQQQRQAEFGKAYQASIQSEIQNWPDLGDPNSDAAKYMSSLLEQNPEFSMTANGFSKAAQVLRLQMEAAESSALREELEQTKAKLQELEKRTAIKGSGPQQHVGGKSFDDMSLDEQRALLRRGATEDDAGRWKAL